MKKEHLILINALWVISLSAWSYTAFAEVDKTARHDDEGKELIIRRHNAAAYKTLTEYIEQESWLQADGQEEHEEAIFGKVITAHRMKLPEREKLIRKYLNQYELTPHATILHGMLGTIGYEKGEWSEAIRWFDECDLSILPSPERETYTLYKAVCLIKTERYDEARTLLDVVETSSNKLGDDLSFYKAYTDYAQGKYEQAADTLNRLAAHPLYGAEARCIRADIYLQQHAYDKAINEIEACDVRLDENHPIAIELKRIAGEAAYAQAAYTEAAEKLQSYIEKGGTLTPAILYKAGMSMKQTGGYEKAAEYLEKAASTAEDELAAWAWLAAAEARLEVRQMAKAKIDLGAALETNVQGSVREAALYNYAMCLHETGDNGWGEGVKVMEQFLNEFPTSDYAGEVTAHLTAAYLETRNYKTALQSTYRIQKPNKETREIRQKLHYRLGTEALAAAEYSAAVSHFTAALKEQEHTGKKEPEALFWRAEAWMQQGEMTKATSDLKAYLNTRNEAKKHEAMYNLGHTAFAEKNYEQSLVWFERYLQNNKQKPNTQMEADAAARAGDCYMAQREFEKAAAMYKRATTENAKAGTADYAWLQLAKIQGLQKKYTEKIASLSHLSKTFPESVYHDDALYEKARAYMDIENTERAGQTLETLLEKHPESPLAPKAAAEIALLHYQKDKYQEAITAYKRVIANYPASGEARQAVEDLKSIYVDINQVKAYAEFTTSLGEGAAAKVAEERDSLTFRAAEKAYRDGRSDEAKESMENYLKEFPSGVWVPDAHFALSRLAWEQQDTLQTLNHIKQVLHYPWATCMREAATWGAAIALEGGEYPLALELYQEVKKKATQTGELIHAGKGIIQAAGHIGEDSLLIATATEMLQGGMLTTEEERWVRYLRAKTACEQGDYRMAEEDWNVLKSDMRNEYGAEAGFRLAERASAEKDYKRAEKLLNSYIETSTPHVYWLARSFILLADTYMQTGREMEAKQYLITLKQNYPQKGDNIATMIEERLKAINN